MTVGPVEIRDFATGTESIRIYPRANIRIVTQLDNGRGGGTGQTHYLHADQLGSVRLITDAAGAQSQRRVYRPFGEIGNEVTWGNPPGN